jgi:dTDP-4-dehydrorhamnose reductase
LNLPEISYTLHPATAGAYAANGIGTRNVAKCAAGVGAPVAFISTDYVFGGEKKSAYLESDATSPLNVFLFPTPTHQVTQQPVRLSRAEAYGLYHATAEGSCSWYEFAQEILTLSEAKVRLVKALPGEFPAKVPRPKYSVLDNKALRDASVNVFTDWRIGLRSYPGARESPLRLMQLYRGGTGATCHPETYDFPIIGAGIVGLPTALGLFGPTRQLRC